MGFLHQQLFLNNKNKQFFDSKQLHLKVSLSTNQTNIEIEMKTFLVLIILTISVHAEKSYKINSNAPEETKHYAPLLGEWTITDHLPLAE